MLLRAELPHRYITTKQALQEAGLRFAYC